MSEFFVFDEVANHQVYNFIKETLAKIFYWNFAKFLKVPSITLPVNASAFNANLLDRELLNP